MTPWNMKKDNTGCVGDTCLALNVLLLSVRRVVIAQQCYTHYRQYKILWFEFKIKRSQLPFPYNLCAFYFHYLAGAVDRRESQRSRVNHFLESLFIRENLGEQLFSFLFLLLFTFFSVQRKAYLIDNTKMQMFIVVLLLLLYNMICFSTYDRCNVKQTSVLSCHFLQTTPIKDPQLKKILAKLFH